MSKSRFFAGRWVRVVDSSISSCGISAVSSLRRMDEFLAVKVGTCSVQRAKVLVGHPLSPLHIAIDNSSKPSIQGLGSIGNPLPPHRQFSSASRRQRQRQRQPPRHKPNPPSRARTPPLTRLRMQHRPKCNPRASSRACASASSASPPRTSIRDSIRARARETWVGTPTLAASSSNGTRCGRMRVHR